MASLGHVTPILRIFDEAEAKEFYVDFLGFKIDWEHMHIRQATTSAEIAIARTMFREYADSVRVDLCFQGFADELANLPGLYAPPRGRLLLCWSSETAAGCVALRPISADVCEMKRLYVRPAYRGQGIGKLLVEAILQEAKQSGYTAICLDTLPTMIAATRLYESAGFRRREPYYDTPLRDTVFMERAL
jgi:GNAT superfamily N-acetyltransferase